jgi:hypothetical protein
MAKSLSVYRRRAGLVDLFLVSRAGAKSYLFKSATNFDVGAVAFQSVPQDGFRSPTAFDSGPAEGFRGRTRFTFAPVDYGFDDTKPIWVKIQQVNVDGTVGADEAFHLVLPYNPQGRKAVVLAGNAPNGASIAASIELQLPHQMQGMELQNNGGQDLYVAFEPGGPEFTVPPLSTRFTNLSVNYPTVSQLFVRGNGAAVAFAAVMSDRNEAL